ncbi:MAG: hypothetical protein WC971_08350 [Coriobacteriia bacterium]
MLVTSRKIVVLLTLLAVVLAGTAAALASGRISAMAVDSVAPVTTSTADSAWHRGSVTVTLTATDASSGVAAVTYAASGATTITTQTVLVSPAVAATSTTFTVANEGTTTVYAGSIDESGNVEATHVVGTVRIDVTSPTVSANLDGVWRYGSYAVSVSATDATSGIASIRYWTSGAATVTTTTVSFGAGMYSAAATFSITAEGTTTVGYEAVDSAGNTSTAGTGIVQVDNVRTTHTFSSSWTSAPVIISMTPTDPLFPSNNSSVLGVWYRAGSMSAVATLYASPFTVSTEGTNAFYFSARNEPAGVSGAPFVETTRTAYVQIDRVAPNTSSNIVTPTQVASYSVVLSATDANSGVVRMYYRLGTAATMSYTTPFSVSTLGPTNVTFWSMDLAGNIETTKSATLTIRRPDPVTTCTIDTAWHSGNVTVSMAATQPGLPAPTILYRVGTGSNTTYTAPFVVSTEGTTPVGCWSIDASGLAGVPTTSVVRIDRTAPSATTTSFASWFPSTTTSTVFSVSATDALSGVRNTYYRVATGTVTTYTASFPVAVNDTMTVSYWSVDIAGNVEATHSVSPRIDRTAPVTVDDGDGAWHVATVTVSLTATDAESGVHATYYRIGAAATATYTAPIAISAGGTTTVSYWSVDAVGNVEPTRTVLVRIDPSGGMRTSTLTLALSSTTATALITTYWAPVTLVGTLLDATGTPLPDKTVIVESSSNGTTFTRAGTASAVATAPGVYRFAVRPIRGVYYRLRFAGDLFSDASVSGRVRILPRAYLTVPTVPTYPRTRYSFTSAGYLKPRYTAGAYTVRIQCYRLEGRVWRLRRTFFARNANYSSYTRYSVLARLPYTGRWALRAYVGGTSTNAATYTAYRYVTVR